MIFKTIHGRYGWKNIIRNIRSQGKSPEKKTNKGDCKNDEKEENSKNVHEEEEEDEEDVY